MNSQTTNSATPRLLTEDELALVSGGARFNPQPDPPGVMHNPPDDLTGIVTHNPPGY